MVKFDLLFIKNYSTKMSLKYTLRNTFSGENEYPENSENRSRDTIDLKKACFVNSLQNTLLLKFIS
ncbi:hypothetical protein GCM10009430_45400 [Aquimarina litoralis]|uniref:Uncharacterized protein n=1 Tax=Aquimarina litoralis TaxID=584605 RepID=A0ABN1J8Q2_9FLAO